MQSATTLVPVWPAKWITDKSVMFWVAYLAYHSLWIWAVEFLRIVIWMNKRVSLVCSMMAIRVALHLRNQKESHWSWLISCSGLASAASTMIHPLISYIYAKDNIWRYKSTFSVFKPKIFPAKAKLCYSFSYITGVLPAFYWLFTQISSFLNRQLTVSKSGNSALQSPKPGSSSENNYPIFYCYRPFCLCFLCTLSNFSVEKVTRANFPQTSNPKYN